MSEQNIDTKVQSDEISLKDLILKIKEIFRYLLKKWRIIVFIGLLGGALGLVSSLMSKVEYTANLSFVVQEKGNSGGGGLAALAGQFGFNVGGGADGVFSGSNIIELLKSRNLIERTLLSEIIVDNKKQRLVEYYIDVSELRKEWDKAGLSVSYPLAQRREDFSRTQDSTLNALSLLITHKKLNISKLSKEAGIFQVKFVNDNELFAKEFVEILVKEVTDFYVYSRVELSKINLSRMEKSADSVRSEIDNLLLKRAVNADRNLDATRQILRVSSQKDEINLQLLGTVYSEMVKNIEILKMDILRETPLIQIIDTPIMPLEKNRLGKAKGIIVGGFLGGFLIVAYLLCALFYRRIMNEDNNVSS